MIFGIGSVYGSTEEKLPQFISSGVACVGWPPEEAPGLHQLLSRISVGDIIFVKSYPPSSGLHIKAVGLVTSQEIFNVPHLGFGRSVEWVWSVGGDTAAIRLGQLNDRYDNMRRGTLYEELGPTAQEKIINILLHPEKYSEETAA